MMLRTTTMMMMIVANKHLIRTASRNEKYSRISSFLIISVTASRLRYLM